VSFQRVHSIDLRNEPFPRTVTRKLRRFEILEEEKHRKHAAPQAAGAVDHAVFRDGIGAVLAELVREVKSDVGSLDPSMNIELDLGFDSLARVELLGNAEARLGVHIAEEQATRIFTLGELIDAFEAAQPTETGAGRNWAEMLSAKATEIFNGHYILNSRTILNPIAHMAMRLVRLLARMFYSLTYSGVERLPKNGAFLVCPNHESFLDGLFICAVLPRRITNSIFVLGYSDYWESPISRRIAQLCNIVAVDPNINLVKAMQIGALGLRHGKVLLIFPEGTRTIDGHLQEFKKGAAILASEVGVPIVPVGIRGTFEAWPRGGSFGFHHVELIFGEPIQPRQFSGMPDPYTAITERLQNDVKILSGDV
jgi:long-chain acyl-CoA synthetase